VRQSISATYGSRKRPACYRPGRVGWAGAGLAETRWRSATPRRATRIPLGALKPLIANSTINQVVRAYLGPDAVRFPSWNRSILTEIYLCHARSCHEIEDGNNARPGAGRPQGGATSGPDPRRGLHRRPLAQRPSGQPPQALRAFARRRPGPQGRRPPDHGCARFPGPVSATTNAHQLTTHPLKTLPPLAKAAEGRGRRAGCTTRSRTTRTRASPTASCGRSTP
jgi:hypothetical protein